MTNVNNNNTAAAETFASLKSVEKPKRKQVKNACVNCQKACKKCDDGRPCQRCMKLGLTATCRDSDRKERKKGIKRGPYKKRQACSKNNPDDSWEPTIFKDEQPVTLKTMAAEETSISESLISQQPTTSFTYDNFCIPSQQSTTSFMYDNFCIPSQQQLPTNSINMDLSDETLHYIYGLLVFSP
ncbi:MAG: hypothetical protein EXX96DRAFT_552585 [Benjaminiella poitrasii]|nr:MAG: hypothetical protein EXX96DRAFT_552585 [Benjaminiella poitrasii]